MAVTQENLAPRNILVTTYDKTGLAEFAQEIVDKNDWEGRGLRIVSFGGSAQVILAAGVDVTPLAEFVGRPDIGEPDITQRDVLVRETVDRLSLPQRLLRDHRDIEPLDAVYVTCKPPVYDQKTATMFRDSGGISYLRAGHDGGRPTLTSPVQLPGFIESLSSAAAHEAYRLEIEGAYWRYLQEYEDAFARLQGAQDLPRY